MSLTRISAHQLGAALQATATQTTDADVAAIGALSDAADGFLKKTGKNAWALDRNVAMLGVDGKLLDTHRPSLLATDVETAMVGLGAIIQSITTTVPAKSGTTTVSLTNATPASTVGTQIWSAAITPNATTSKVRVNGSFMFVSGTASRILIAYVFRGTTCIGTIGGTASVTASPYPITINILDSPASTAATTYSIRVGLTSAATWYVNQFATPYLSGTLALNTISLHELA